MLRTALASIVTTLAVLASGSAHAQWGYPATTYPATTYPSYNSYSTYYAPTTTYPTYSGYGNCPNGMCGTTYGRATSYYAPTYSNCPNGMCGTSAYPSYSTYYAPTTSYPAYSSYGNCPNGNCYQQPAYRGYAPVYYPVGGSNTPVYSVPSATTSNYGPTFQNRNYDTRSNGNYSNASQINSPYYE
ncbi:MAG: hypothetical protein IT428_09840 [Planctomycetaceae bacterium]|nr:hypothetical protein [Planctomycetaceae bacterium]